MYHIKVKRRSARACYRQFRYFGDRSHRNHRTLTGIRFWYFECRSIFQFVAQATLAVGWIKQAEDLEFVEYMGGSTYRAFLTDEEVQTWLMGFVVRMKLVRAIIVAHRRKTGRMDFHILAPSIDREARKLLAAESQVSARLIATELTDALNQRRLQEGRRTIGNVRVGPYGTEVYYLKREDLGPVSPEVAPPKTESEVAPLAEEAPRVASPEKTVAPKATPDAPPAVWTAPPLAEENKAPTTTAQTPQVRPPPPPLAPVQPVEDAEDDEEAEERKRKEAEAEKLKALCKEADAARLRDWLLLVPDSYEKPPQVWLDLANALKVPAVDAQGNYATRAFLKVSLPAIVAHLRRDATRSPDSKDLEDTCLKLAATLVATLEGRQEPEPYRDTKERRGPEMA